MAEYIEREKAIETVKFYDGYNDPIPWAVDSLKVIPAADVVPVVRGEWILKTYDDGHYKCDVYVCSKCGGENARPRKFCHDCGADMRGNDSK